MAEAAKMFGVSLTLFKRICRKNGIQRWPHRKLRSLENKIADLQTRLEEPAEGPFHSPPNGCAHGRPFVSSRSQGSDNCGDSVSSLPSTQTCVDGVQTTSVSAFPQPHLSYDQLKQYFNLPLTEAAKLSGVCPTVFKKICRKNGITKWPHRKLKSLQTKIVDLQSRMSGNHGSNDDVLKRRLEQLGCVDSNPQFNTYLEPKIQPEPQLQQLQYQYMQPQAADNCFWQNTFFNTSSDNSVPPDGSSEVLSDIVELLDLPTQQMQFPSQVIPVPQAHPGYFLPNPQLQQPAEDYWGYVDDSSLMMWSVAPVN
eukprot:TRINITY_DN3565_c0_g1_i4.p1 TRINITY_DN3565_c0_g1~~TRINITY_DN3565_c0_g1_i4.p1  ORF type:complete len:310 (+),score=28.48 TRINITY_DN3565_c0_g1_i4:152-1081(+)